MWIKSINNFNEAEARYRDTKVLVSKHHTVEDDVRPVGNRGRKWERIVKVNANCYALFHGGVGDPIFSWGSSRELIKEHPMSAAELMKVAPVLWRKYRDGSETITVRNGQGKWGHNSRYSFLKRVLPRGLNFIQTRVGVQYISIPNNGRARAQYYLPKTRTIPRYHFEYLKGQALRNYDWAKNMLSAATTQNDGLGLTFRRAKIGEGAWELVGKSWDIEVVRNRVDKDKKKPLKVYINAMWDWMQAMYPMLRAQVTTYGFREDQRRVTKEWCEKNLPDVSVGWSQPLAYFPVATLVAILKDVDHPLWFTFGVSAMYAVVNTSYRQAETLNRKDYVRWINKTLQLVTKVVE